MYINRIILFILIFCNGVLSLCCGRHPIYPDEWPEILAYPVNGCNNISGVYSDKYHESSLTHLIVFGGKGFGYDTSAENIIRAATHVVIIQSDRTIELRIMDVKKVLLEKTLILGKDAFCEDGLHVRTSSLACQEGVIGYGEDNYNLLRGKDDSLIINHNSSGYGAYTCFPIIVPSDTSYYRFRKYTDN